MANDTEFGLASYFYSRDLARVFRVAEALDYGMVGINTGLCSVSRVESTGEWNVIGDTVNLASRLEHAAEVGSVLIGSTTREHVRATQAPAARRRVGEHHALFAHEREEGLGVARARIEARATDDRDRFEAHVRAQTEELGRRSREPGKTCISTPRSSTTTSPSTSRISTSLRVLSARRSCPISTARSGPATSPRR